MVRSLTLQRVRKWTKALKVSLKSQYRRLILLRVGWSQLAKRVKIWVLHLERSREATLETETWPKLIELLLVTPRVVECKRKQQVYLQNDHRMRSLVCWWVLTKGHLMPSTQPPVAIESHTGVVMVTIRALIFLPISKIIAGRSRRTWRTWITSLRLLKNSARS